MKKILLLMSLSILVVVFAFSASMQGESTEYKFVDEGGYTESDEIKIIDHVVYKLIKPEKGDAYYVVYDWFDSQEAAETVEEINIPSEIDGISVTAIQPYFYDGGMGWVGDFQFEYEDYVYNNHNYSVKKITIPDTITDIGEGFFSVLDGVTELVFPDGFDLKKDGYARYKCFYNMESLERVTYLGDVTYAGGFPYCKNLKSVTFNGSVEYITQYAFNNCISLEHFDIPEGVECIGDEAFVNSGLTEITVPDGVSLSDGLFYGCKNLKEVYLGNTRSAPQAVFGDCTALEKVVYTDRESVFLDGFYGCTSLKEVILPETVKEVTISGFGDCISLEKLDLPASCEKVTFYNGAFSGCISLKEFVFPENCKTIITNPYKWSRDLFSGCTSLKRIVFPEKCETVILEGPDLFRNCTSLKTVTFPKSCEKMVIGEKAFYGLPAVEKIVFPETCGTLEIKNEAFRGSAKLKTVTLPKTSDSIIIRYKAFRDCKALTTVYNTTNIERIYGGAFRDCTSLTSFTVPDNLMFIGKNAFYGCTKLSKVTVNSTKKVPKLYPGAFDNTAKSIVFTAKNETMAKKWKTSLVGLGLKTMKVGYMKYV